MSRTITETRMLRYNFTPDEHLANAAEMARLYDHVTELEETHKSIKASLKEQETVATSDLARVSRLVRDKCDHRKTECRWIYDCPTVGQKTLRRNDTDADVEVRRMEDFEKQESLNLQPTTEELPLTETVEVPALNGGDPGVVTMPSCVSCENGSPFSDDARMTHINGMKCGRFKSDAPAMPETARAEKRTPKFGK